MTQLLQHRRNAGIQRIFQVCTILVLIVMALPEVRVQAAELSVACSNGVGDTDDLIATIQHANHNRRADTISLGAGCTYTLTKIDNISTGANGLPVIQPDRGKRLIIEGNGAIIRRADGGPQFRLIEIASGATVIIQQVTLSGGVALTDNGGGVLNLGNLTLIESTVTDNLARGDSGNGSAGGVGGGIYNKGTLALVRSTVSNNQALGGNGVARSSSQHAGGGGLGGAIFNQQPGTLTMINSTLSGNQAIGGPGANGGRSRDTNEGDADAEDSTSSSRSSARDSGDAGSGGAVFNNAGTITLSYSTITANQALSSTGAGDYASDAEGQSSPGLGGGIFNNSGQIIYRSSIISANDGETECTSRAGRLLSRGFNLAGTGCATSDDDIATSDPGLAALGDNGGLTLTHVPLSGSLAIDASKSSSCPAIDQRGISRPQGKNCDIGAVEFFASSQTFVVGNTSDSGPGSLRQALIDANNSPADDTIIFELPSEDSTIQLLTELPLVVDAVLIDATSDPANGCDGNQLVTITPAPGSKAADAGVAGLTLTGGGSTICGLIISGFAGPGVLIPDTGGNAILNNTIRDNGGDGVSLTGGDGDRIQRNTIFANAGSGIAIAMGVPAPAAPTIETVVETDTGIVLTGTISAEQHTAYSVDLFASLISVPCSATNSGQGEIYLASVDVPPGAAGQVGFNATIIRSPTELVSRWITAVVTDEDHGRSSTFSQCEPIETNDLWTNARPLSLTPTGTPNQTGAMVSQAITSSYQERWYSFPVQPDSRVRIILRTQPGSTISLHRDLEQVYTDLSNPASPVEQAASELPGGYLPGGYLPGGYLPGGYLPGGYLPGGYLPGGYLPELYSGAVRDSLIAFAGDLSASELLIDRNTWDIRENLYIRVTGPVDTANPFSIELTVDDGLCSDLALPTGAVVAGGTPDAHNGATLILWDATRVTGDAATLAAALSSFAARPEISGRVLDISNPQYERVASARAERDRLPTCAVAAQQLATEIKAVADVYRGTTMRYIVLVGDDSVFPFFRYPDAGGLAAERDYFPPVEPTSAAEAALRQNRVLGQDEYGSSMRLWRGSYYLPVPDLAVGRLLGDVESVLGLLNAYTGANPDEQSAFAGPVVRPASALVTGYDFVADGAQAVSNELLRGFNLDPDACQSGNDCLAPTELISPQAALPSESWTADDLRDLLLGTSGNTPRNDLVFFTGHFDAGSALAADYTSSVLAEEISGADADFTNSILFGLGCHSGYNVPESDSLLVNINGTTYNLSPDPDWGEVLARARATLIASTGYAYGDTELTEYGERFLINLAAQLRTGSGAVAIGAAQVRAKQVYLAEKPVLSGLDEKTLLEFVLYGLPMLMVDMPGERLPGPGADSIVETSVPVNNSSAGLAIGQRGGSNVIRIDTPTTRVDVNLTDILNQVPVIASYYSGRSGVVAVPIDPILPLDRNNVGLPDRILRGVLFRGGEFTDVQDFRPLTSAPTTEQSVAFPGFYSETFYPIQNWSANYFATLNGGQDQLMVIPGQYISAGPGQLTGTLRLYSAMEFQFFYLSADQVANSAELQAAAAPEIALVERSCGLPNGSQRDVCAYIVDKAGVGIQQVTVTYTSPNTPDRWIAIDLVSPTDAGAENPTLWSTPDGFSLPTDTLFMIQAVNGVGQVSLNTNGGRYFGAQEDDPDAVATTLTLVSVTPALPADPGSVGAIYGRPLTFRLRLSGPDGPLGGKPLRIVLDGSAAFGVTNASGEADLTITPLQIAGDYLAQARFAGDAGFQASSLSLPLQLAKERTRLSLSTQAAGPVPSGAPTGIIATLTIEGGAPIADKTIFFVATDSDGVVFVKTVKTGQNGQAVLGAVPWPAGSYNVSAFFSGVINLPGQDPVVLNDLFYEPSIAEPSAVHLELIPAGRAQLTPTGNECDAFFAGTAADLILTANPQTGHIAPGRFFYYNLFTASGDSTIKVSTFSDPNDAASPPAAGVKVYIIQHGVCVNVTKHTHISIKHNIVSIFVPQAIVEHSDDNTLILRVEYKSPTYSGVDTTFTFETDLNGRKLLEESILTRIDDG